MFPATVRQFTLVKYLKYKAKLKWCICTENIKPLYMVILFLEGQKCTFKKGKAAKSAFNFTDMMWDKGQVPPPVLTTTVRISP